MARSRALASNPNAQEAAEGVLSAGGGALQAALTGYFVAAGHDPGVLLAPLTLLVGGVGAGVFAYDGRCRQPGRDAKRPRGFLPEDEVPVEAYVAASASVSALATAVAFHPGTSLLSCARPGVQVAKSMGAKGRAQILEHVATLGATAFLENSVKKAFLSQYGVLEQGAITHTDLATPEGLNPPAVESENDWYPSWGSASVDTSLPFGGGHGIIAGDARGLFVALAYTELSDEIMLEPFEVALPRLAQPVLRGVPRINPGSSIGTPQKVFLEKGARGSLRGVRLVPYEGAAALRLVRNAETREISSSSES